MTGAGPTAGASATSRARPSSIDDGAAVGERLRRLAGEERVAAGWREHRVGQAGRRASAPSTAATRCLGLVAVERLEVDHRAAAVERHLLDQPLEVGGAPDPGRSVTTVSTARRRAGRAAPPEPSDSRSATWRSSSTSTTGPRARPPGEPDGGGEHGRQIARRRRYVLQSLDRRSQRVGVGGDGRVGHQAGERGRGTRRTGCRGRGRRPARPAPCGRAARPGRPARRRAATCRCRPRPGPGAPRACPPRPA